MASRMRIMIDVGEDKLVCRSIKIVSFGNFQQMIVRYKNDEYLVGDGDEYLRGYNKVYKLGKKLVKGIDNEAK